MRTVYNLNNKWAFSRTADAVPLHMPTQWEPVNLPHCWNAIDGQDGGADYHRGICYYAKTIDRQALPTADCYYLEIRGANSSAEVFLDGKRLAGHDGGYSIWRVDLTEHLQAQSLLVIAVDNTPNDRVYPQMADFTFYGGLYRDVNIICVDRTHFDLDHYGGPGLAVTPEMVGGDAKVTIRADVTNAKAGQTLRYAIADAQGQTVAEAESADTEVVLEIRDAHRWHGRRDPYLYTASVEIWEDGQMLDRVSTRFGCRTFRIDPENGFILNGEEYPLRGVSRHQDRWGIGNALLPEHHREDIELILEVGATTVRLAHYQHDPYFYDLCDEKGLVVWAEIPYISRHMPTGRENTVSQMKELITQNYNHVSIAVWGLSNEITMAGAADPDLLENHRILNELVHDMDKTRLTTIACVSMCGMDEEIVRIPDVVAYNHYFGWYGGETDMNGPWFDTFHEKYPHIPIGCSEYGCEALNWHTSSPEQGDYTEEYQAYYHEELIKQFFSRKYLWATYVWNMFDFGADARNEGGENGQNHKGLITIDRKYKKDAFYAYKAWLSDEPFVHLCGKRYVDRVEDITRVTIYSNQRQVELFANGKSMGTQISAGHFFYFDVHNVGQTSLVAVAGECRDESMIRKVDTFNEAYRLVESHAVLNWFDIHTPEGRFSLNDKMGDIMATAEGRQLLTSLMTKWMGEMGGTNAKVAGFEVNADMLQMMNSFTMMRLIGLMGAADVQLSKEELLDLNARLNTIPKPAT